MTDSHTSRHIIQKIWISIAPFKELKKQEARIISCLLLIINYAILKAFETEFV